MSYESKFKNFFFNINRDLLVDKEKKARFINPSLSETGIKFRNYLFSRVLMCKTKTTHLTVSTATRNAKFHDFPFTSISSIRKLVCDWSDSYFDLTLDEEVGEIIVKVKPIYFSDFKNATLRVNFASFNPKSMGVMARDLKNIYLSTNKENYVYLNEYCSEMGKFSNTSIECKKQRHKTFKSAIRACLMACKTVDSSTIRWCSKTYRFFYELTVETMEYIDAIQQIKKLGKAVVGSLQNLLDSMRDSAKADKKAVKYEKLQNKASKALQKVISSKKEKKTSNLIKNILKNKQEPKDDFDLFIDNLSF
ncbi:hypothetical protein A0H77_19590 [Vibrio alginolyticus]|uniref:phage tail assembly chaperone n=1 Tax=Vibrio alginolyticus TaxID=663 RepID=UPI0007956DFD|nr:hypothetical protein [Vibrio alginolyticus]KXZ35102.1 hypothetical protein A0H77_19590 [Vibrio alginolyticus]